VPKLSTAPPLPTVEIIGDRVVLRAWRDGDVDCVADASTDPRIPQITTVPSVCTAERALAFVERQRMRLVTGEGWALAIADDTGDEALGHIGLWLHQVRKGRAEIGYWVRPSARGEGVAGRALVALSEWAFANLDVHRLSLFIEPGNEASQRTAAVAGYEREALLSRWELIGGEPRDMWSYRRLRPTERSRQSSS
jgi:RimJ/RimL family protein N-acetyltransferase